MVEWLAGLSFTNALAQPYNRDQLFQQYRSSYPTNLTPPEFMAHGSQGSTSRHPRQGQEHHHFQPELSEPRSQATESVFTGFRNGNWSILEDEKLCHAWVKISNDPITGSSQKAKTFWSRVFEDFAKQHGPNEPLLRN
ncbi:hypothetical protein Dimus_024188 [Dionaea muscipula]